MNLRFIFSSTFISLLLIALLHGINHTFYNMLGPLYLTIQEYFNFSAVSQVALLGTVFLAFYGATNLLWGFLSDKIKKVYIISSGTILAGACFFLIGFLDNYGLILVIIALAGFAAAVYHPAGTALTTILFKNKMGLALGISGTGATLGLCGAPILSGLMAKYFSWQSSFQIIGIIAILFGMIFLLQVKEPAPIKNPEPQGKNKWDKKLIRWLIIITGIMVFREFCGWGAGFLIPIYSQEILGYDCFWAGIAAGMGIIGGLVTGPLAGYLSDKYSRPKILMGLLILLTAAVFLIPFFQNSYVFLILFLFGCCYAASVPVLDALIGQDAPDAIKGTVFGITVTAAIGMSAIVPWILAKIIDYNSRQLIGFKISFGVLAVSLIIAIGFLGIYNKLRPKVSGTVNAP